MTQTSLFSATSADVHFADSLNRHDIAVEEVDIGDITFQSGQAETIHRWYRLTPSYSPALVRYFIRELGIGPASLVLDPFSGRGTTAIELQRHGLSCLGVEVNPLLQKCGALSLAWRPLRSSAFKEYLDLLASTISEHRSSTVEEVAAKLSTRIPDIHDVFRWWRPEVLRDLMLARELATDARFSDIHHFLWLALAKTSLDDCANIHRNHPTITFDDAHSRTIDVLAHVRSCVEAISRDLNMLTEEQAGFVGRCSVVLGDARMVDQHLSQYRGKVTHVITSPPYPNRFSYVHQTRPQLHFMEVIETRGQATEIDLASIGGTWGRATSNLMKEYFEVDAAIEPILDYIPELKAKSVLMCNYANKYFVDLDRHIASLRKLVASRFEGVYVVGNSRLAGVEIYTESVLARLFRKNGFSVDRVLLFRKRGGRKRLYETAICVRASP